MCSLLLNLLTLPHIVPNNNPSLQKDHRKAQVYRLASRLLFNPVLQSELSSLGTCNLLIALPSFI